MIKKQVKLKKKTLFRRLIKLITSNEDLNINESFYLAAYKKREGCPKNRNRKEKWLKPVSLCDIAVLFHGIPERKRGIFSMVPLVHYRNTLPFEGATGSL